MRQQEIEPYCNFCGAEFSNYENILIDNYMDTMYPAEDKGDYEDEI